MSADILIVDDEEDIRHLIQGILEDDGYRTRTVGHSKGAYEAIAVAKPALIILDIWLQGSEQDGLEILAHVKEEHPHLPVIMISGHGTIETAVSAIKQGAYDFIEKPFKSDRLLLMIQRALENAALRQENENLRKRADRTAQHMVGSSASFKQLQQLLSRVAKTNSRVLLSGEAGAGKELAAHAIHRGSERSDQAFITVNCASLDAAHFEEKLFGTQNSPGLLEQAQGGTLFFDEIADIPANAQAKLVRIIQEQQFKQDGQSDYTPLDIRIISSSNRDLEREIENGQLREDLYYRLNVVPISIPPLRDHAEDIPELCVHFVNVLNQECGLPVYSFSDSALAAMKTHDWPGNIRQLRNVIEWTLIMKGQNDDSPVEITDLPPEVSGVTPGDEGNVQATGALNTDHLFTMPLKEAREKFERHYLNMQVKRFDGNISKTAQFIGMERSALHRKLKALNKEGHADLAADLKLVETKERAG